MNEENKMDPQPMQPSAPMAPTTPKSSGSYWIVVLILMALVLAGAIYLAYKKSTSDYMVNKVAPETGKLMQEDASVDDSNKTPSEVSEELMVEIEDIEKTDVSTQLNDSQIDEMKE